jgi:cellulose synthase (UDP-forming)
MTNDQSYLKPGTLLLRYLTVINLVLGAWYLQWRLFYSLDRSVLWLSIPVLLAEIYVYFWWALFFLGLWRSSERETVPLNQRNPPFPIDKLPQVDVTILRNGEPREIVEKTVRASLAIDYPREKLFVYLLDRDNSEELRQAIEAISLEDVTIQNNNSTNSNKLFKLQVNSDKSNLELVLSWFDTLRQPSMENSFWYESKLALAESFDNVIDHAHKDLPSDTPIEIEVIIASKFLTIKTWDCGPGFNLELSLQQSTKEINDCAERGRGIEILKQIADRLDYTITEERGNCLLIVKYYDRASLNLLSRCRYLPDESNEIGSNLNYSLILEETKGDFLLILEADRFPKPQILQRLLPYFYRYDPELNCYRSNQISFVQTPQKCSNIQNNYLSSNTFYLFDRIVQQGRDGFGAVLYEGNNVLLRKKSLTSLTNRNFFSSSSNYLSNFHIDIILHSLGWQGIFERENLFGSCATVDSVYRLKRVIWLAIINFQVLLKEILFNKSNLAFWQKFKYFQIIYNYFSVFVILIFFSCPFIYFFTDLVPLRYDNILFVTYFLPAFLFNCLTFLVASRDISLKEVWHYQQYPVILLPAFSLIARKLFTGKLEQFSTIDRESKSLDYFQTIWLNVLLLLLNIIGTIWSCFKFLSIGDLERSRLFVINISWSIYNIFLLLPIVRLAMCPPKSS